MKSLKIFFKLWWYLSVIVVFLFFIVLETYRIYDYTTGNYSIQKMKITEYKLHSDRNGKSIMVIGYIDDDEVYFSRFKDEVNKLYKLYPQIFPRFFSDDKKTYEIKVLKFEHSSRVMLIDDEEFPKWKKRSLLSSLYIILSIIIMIVLKKNRKTEKNILT